MLFSIELFVNYHVLSCSADSQTEWLLRSFIISFGIVGIFHHREDILLRTNSQPFQLEGLEDEFPAYHGWDRKIPSLA